MRLPVFVGALLLAAPLFAADTPQSGPAPGDKMKPFDVVDVTGQFKAEPKVCYVCKSGDRPVVFIFSREVDKTLAGLVKEIDKSAAENKGLGVVVLLSDDKKAATDALNKLAKDTGAKNVAMTINDAGTKSPEWLKINNDVKHTVTMYKEKTVEKSTALNDGTDAQVKEIAAAATKIFKAAG